MYREGLPEVPDLMRWLPIDKRGFPVPWFTPRMADGEWNFQVIMPGRIEQALKFRCCWICGKTLFKNLAFVLGPMCAITRTSSEPPSHCECASFAAKACPFLTRPRMRRAPVGEELKVVTPGILLERNPGVCLVWVTRRFTALHASGGLLFTVGEPIRVEAYSEGRPALPEEIEDSIAGGLPRLVELAQQDEAEAPGALAELERRLELARRLMGLRQSAS
jgi:hypothetical protein